MIRAVVYLVDFLRATAKIFLLLIFVLFIPWLFLWYIQIQKHGAAITDKTTRFELGVEVISKKFLKSLTPRNDLLDLF